MRRTITATLLVAALAAITVVTVGAATAPASKKFHRGWAISGWHPYFQLWNPGPGEICVEHMTVTVTSATPAVLLAMDYPLGRTLTQEGANGGEGVAFDQTRSQAELRVSFVDGVGGQIYSFRMWANEPHRIDVNDCIPAQKGLGIRIPTQEHTTAHIGVSWTEG